jgi:hypothetical protein
MRYTKELATQRLQQQQPPPQTDGAPAAPLNEPPPPPRPSPFYPSNGPGAHGYF